MAFWKISHRGKKEEGIKPVIISFTLWKDTIQAVCNGTCFLINQNLRNEKNATITDLHLLHGGSRQCAILSRN
jgi:hypothetical protein